MQVETPAQEVGNDVERRSSRGNPSRLDFSWTLLRRLEAADAMSSSLVSPKPVSYLDQGIRYRWDPTQRGYGGTPAQQVQAQLPHALTPGLGSHPPGIGPVLGGVGAQVREIDVLTEHFHVAEQKDKICSLVADLMDAHTREAALLELSKKREQYDELALILWHSFGMSSQILLVVKR